ncbi:porin [Paraburkholderia sp. RL17-337-BIB-A]|uniref:porin n=1 Tax=Paraburkholderia sp. RL17-337-BIB-A TaxID=3031636 RepID=UPI0038B72272
MKRLLTGGASLAFALLPLHAFAQSSVTLYGVIDEGINYTTNASGHSAVQMESGYATGSRWGLKGSEDLGGGLKAIFQLENGFNAGTGGLGQGGRLFGRQAYVGLSSATLGAVTMGRQYDSVVDYLGPVTANGNWAGSLFSHPLDNDNTNNSFRLNNTVKYTSANYRGLTFGGLYGFSNQAGQFSNNRAYGLGARYVGGPLTVAAAYMEINNPGSSTNTLGSLTNDTNFTAARQRVWGAGVNYKIGNPTTVGFVYTHTDLSNAIGSEYTGTFTTPASSLKFDNFELNVKQQITPGVFVGALYDYTRVHVTNTAGKSTPNWNEVGLMADYAFSARTDVYVQGMYAHVSGGGAGAGVLNMATLVGATASSTTANQLLVRVALRARF